MTFLGAHTVPELADWLDALDFQVTQMQAAAASSSGAWATRDAAGFAAWSRDWAAFLARYGAARAAGRARIAAAATELLPATANTCEAEWQAVEAALNAAPGGPSAPENFQGLYARLAAARGAVDFSGTPQPRRGTDADLDAYQGADGVIRKVEAGGASLLPLLVGVAGVALVLLLRKASS